jgi:hypothetical protein
MRYRLTLISLTALAALLVCHAAGFSQGPVRGVSRAEYEKVPVWRPEEEKAGDVPRVDLRKWLPPVGNQGNEGSCVGWAVAYACKSYLEARDRQWRPNRTGRVFSPAFIYNQINHGKDLGSSLQDALRLVVAKGCATLATMPYREGRYRTRPSAAAFREAARYRSYRWYRLQTGTQVRTALRQGHVVVITVATNPLFNQGQFRVYTARQKRAGEAQLVRGAQPGCHAMCVVGYDDRRHCFLIMNSWGTAWGDQGFCWVHYPLMKAIGPARGNFVAEAYVLLNRPRGAAPARKRPSPRSPSHATNRGSDRLTGCSQASTDPAHLLPGFASPPGRGQPLARLDGRCRWPGVWCAGRCQTVAPCGSRRFANRFAIYAHRARGSSPLGGRVMSFGEIRSSFCFTSCGFQPSGSLAETRPGCRVLYRFEA